MSFRILELCYNLQLLLGIKYKILYFKDLLNKNPNPILESIFFSKA